MKRINKTKLKTVAKIEALIKSLYPAKHKFHRSLTSGFADAQGKGRIERLRHTIRTFAKEIGA